MKKDLKEFRTLKRFVEELLLTRRELRDSDISLTIAIWSHILGRTQIELSELYDLPTQETIKRIRAWFNQRGLYLSDRKEILRRRQQMEGKMREDLGYNV